MTYILTLLIVVPLVGAVVAWAVGTSQRLAKWIALAFSLVETALATFLLFGFINPSWAVFFGAPTATPPPTAGAYVPLFYMERYGWISQFGLNYIVGVDGLSVPLIWLTALLTTLAIVFHWDEENRPRAFFGLFLFLEMALAGVFMALDFFLFAIFWELVLLPMFFLIGIWGGSNRRYAALKFLIFTHVGFVIMLIGIFTLYFHSAGVNNAVYGNFRINMGMLPEAMKGLWWVLAILGTVSMVYAAFVCLAQVDLKRLIAYSSVGHMGFVLLGASSLTVIGVQGAIFQLFNHGIITAILFMLAGSVKHATGTRDIPDLQGLAKVMPQFSLVLAIVFLVGFFPVPFLGMINAFTSASFPWLGGL